jgi:hypothetical protein
MTTYLDKGLDLWQEVAFTLNKIIKEEGSIDINNTTIWKKYLNTWENEEWELVLTAVATLYEQYPELFKRFHVEAFKESARALVKHMDSTDRVLDKRLFKKTAWKMLMTMRELWNAGHEAKGLVDKSARKLSEFENLFTT